MTLWWVERERDGKVDHVVRASCELTFCDGYMSAVHDLQPGDNFRMCRRLAGGDREVVDEYTPPADGSDDRPAGEGASGGEWRTGPTVPPCRDEALRGLRGTGGRQMKYFVCDGEDTWFVATEHEARREARLALDNWRCLAKEDGEWDDEVRDVCWGVVRQEAKGIGLDDGVDFRIEDVEPATTPQGAVLLPIVQELFERREYAECWFGDQAGRSARGDCANWATCDPDCPLVRLREMAGIKGTDDGSIGPVEAGE